MDFAAHFVRALVALLAACGMMLGAAHAQCADPFQVAAQTGTSAFVQTRHLTGVRTPLVSRGQAVVAPGRVEWRVTDPIDIRTVITPTGITQSVENGPAQTLGPQGADPFTSGAGLFDLLVGDFAAVRTHYDIARLAPAANGSWRLRLTPRAAGLARFVSEIEVNGCSAIDGVAVRQANGDRMEITLTRQDG
jgi:hypothetical protein